MVCGSISGLSGWARECVHGSYEAALHYLPWLAETYSCAAQLGSGTKLVRDLREGLADARAGRVFPAGEAAADLAAARAAGNMTGTAPYAITFTPAAARCSAAVGRGRAV
jgi:hypothetical protein